MSTVKTKRCSVVIMFIVVLFLSVVHAKLVIRTTQSDSDTIVPKVSDVSATIRHSKSRLPNWLWSNGRDPLSDITAALQSNDSQEVTIAQSLSSAATELDSEPFNPEQSNDVKSMLQIMEMSEVEPTNLTLRLNETDYDEKVQINTTKTHLDEEERASKTLERNRHEVDVVTHFLRIVESQHLLGDNCTAGTDLKLGEGVVDRYAQEKFRVEADLAVNRANMLTRLWKYAEPIVRKSEYLLHASVFSMVEFDDDIFAAGNCYDEYQYKDYGLYCPFAYRLPEGTILVKDLAVEYKYLSNTSEFFYIARKNAQRVINNYNQISRGYHTYPYNDSAHGNRISDEILAVRYEDGKWSQPYYDCGGGNIWMLTYTVPFFGYANGSYFFKGTSGIDIDLRRVDIDQCPSADKTHLNIFAASDKCKKDTTQCVAIAGLGFRRGSYKCVCKRGYYFPDVHAIPRYYNGTLIEEEYEKLLVGLDSEYSKRGTFECLPCSEGCDHCMDERPCVVSLNWITRTVLLVLTCVVICCLPWFVVFTWKYGHVKVVRAASPVLLRVITLGAFFIYCTVIVMYPTPSVYSCTAKIWLREIGFSLTYGALMLKTWRISVIFHVRSAKAVKITDLNLLQRLCVIVAIFCSLLMIRTLVAPPEVIIGRTSDDLKAYLCTNNWWDHMFTTMEVAFLVWGIRLCVMVRKTPSEFNESKFISMAIYNEFILSLFLNISMFFLQSPANPDLQYIIFFCHTQLSITLLLCLIFGSKLYIVLKEKSKADLEPSVYSCKTPANKFAANKFNKSALSSPNPSTTEIESNAKSLQQHFQDEYQKIYSHLCKLKDKHSQLGNRQLVAKITEMQVATLKCIVVTNGVDAAPRKQSIANNGLEPITSCYHDHDTNNGKSPKEIESHKSVMCRADNGATIHYTDSVFDPNAYQASGLEPLVGITNLKDLPVPLVGSLQTPTSGANDASISNLTNVLNNSLSTIASKSSSSSLRNRSLRSGHARTHSIIINLDDKTKFTEEITV